MDERIFLLADDDGDDRDLFCEALKNIDSTIVCCTAADGREAFKKLGELDKMPELIFLDVNMPFMNGWQCLQILKEDLRYKEIPVITISTSSYQRDIDRAIELGALCYLSKPNDFNDLIQVLKVFGKNPGASLVDALNNLRLSGSPFVHTR